MGDSQFSVGVKVVLDIESERGRIGAIPQAAAGAGAGADVPSLALWASSMGRAPSAQSKEEIRKAIRKEVEEAMARDRIYPSTGGQTDSTSWGRSKHDTPSTVTKEEREQNRRPRRSFSMMEFLQSPLDVGVKLTASAVQSVPVIGGITATGIRTARMVQQAMASGNTAFAKGAVKSIFKELEKAAEGIPGVTKAMDSAIDTISNVFDAGEDAAITLEAKNLSLMPTIEKTAEFAGALGKLNRGKPMDVSALIDFAKGINQLEYLQNKYGMKRKVWMMKWAGESFGAGMMDALGNSIAN